MRETANYPTVEVQEGHRQSVGAQESQATRHDPCGTSHHWRVAGHWLLAPSGTHHPSLPAGNRRTAADSRTISGVDISPTTLDLEGRQSISFVFSSTATTKLHRSMRSRDFRFGGNNRVASLLYGIACVTRSATAGLYRLSEWESHTNSYQPFKTCISRVSLRNWYERLVTCG